jgi:hypothetical protein
LLAEGLLDQEVPKKMHQNSYLTKVQNLKETKNRKKERRKEEKQHESGVWNACFCCQWGLQPFPISCGDA